MRALVLLLCLPAALTAERFDVAVFGATPGGISAALTSARQGRRTVLIAAGKHLGGMMSSGLSITDVRFPAAFGGLFREFVNRVHAHYVATYGRDSQQARDSNEGLWFEPHVAERVFEQMLAAAPRVLVLRQQRLEGALKRGARVIGLVASGRTIEATVAIDTSYEGDLAAAAGVQCRVGRESRDEFQEPYAGFVFLRNPGLQILPGSTGEGDRRIQAYNYRLCMTNRPDLRVAIAKPAGYLRDEYLALAQSARRGEISSIHDVIRLAPIPNGKFAANNSPIARSLDLPEVNYDYPEANEQRRAEIVECYKNYTLGLLWFLANDRDLPVKMRAEAAVWGLCRDEFADNGHLPYELYVREARRIVGRATLTAHDAFLAPGMERTPIHSHSVAVADYHVDSHIVQRPKTGWPQMEGHVYLRPISKPAQVPYEIMIPRDVQGLLVSGAVSATHLGFSVLRMEPAWMALGQAAGMAAHLAVERGLDPGAVPVEALQRRLIESGQVISFFYDVPGPDSTWLALNRPAERTRQLVVSDLPEPRYSPGVQYFGTKGFFTTYYARPYDPLTRAEAARWLARLAELERLERKDVIEPWAESGGDFPSAAVSRADALRWVGRLLRRNVSAPPSWKPRPDAYYVTREEFCDLLYSAAPSLR